MPIRGTIVLSASFLIVLIALGLALCCIAIPARVIRSQARHSWLVTEESALNRAKLWELRIFGAVGVFFAIFFLVAIVDKLWGIKL